MSRIESSLRCSAQIKSLPEFVRTEYIAAADYIAELEAERDTLKARITGGVEVKISLGMIANVAPVLSITHEEFAELAPFNGQTVTVIGDKP